MVAKLTDVAKLAGVSPTTVSRVINKKGYLSEKTIAKVHEAMKELHYHPNNLARSLQGKSTKIVGLIFPALNNVFYAELIDHLERELFNMGYKTIQCNSEHNSDKEREYIQMLQANQVEGIIAGAHNLNHDDYTNIKAPIISFDRFLASSIPIVSSDNYQGGVLATRSLINHGIQKIIMLTGSNDIKSPTHLRTKGYIDEMNKAGLDPKVISINGSFTPLRKSVEISKMLKSEQPEGIFCSDDMKALLVINEAEKLGLSAPKDFKLVGYDGTSFIENYFPKLTTVKQPLGELAKLCVELLIQKIEGDNNQEDRYEIPVKLISGQTS